MLRGRRGRIAVTVFSGATRPANAFVYIWLQPFAEEATYARYSSASIASALACDGATVAILDSYGCGDSEGELDRASFDDWIDDGLRVMRWLRKLGYMRASICGLRFGAALAIAIAARNSPIPIASLILLAPTLSGHATLAPYRRAAALAGVSWPPSADSNAPVYIEGYRFTAPFVASIDAVTISLTSVRRDVRVYWVDLSSPALRVQPQNSFFPNSAVKHSCIACHPFWLGPNKGLTHAETDAFATLLRRIGMEIV
jgi:alpha-beta hydrolase superfamily lysophospholipase